MEKYNKLDNIKPGYISYENPRYIETDRFFYSGYFVTEYNLKYTNLILERIIESKFEGVLSLHIKQKDKYKTIKDLTSYITNLNVEKDEITEEIDIIDKTSKDAKYLRKKLQLSNEEIYEISLYIKCKEDSVDKLNESMKNIENICLTQGMIPKKTNFRQKELFKVTMPMNMNDEILNEVTKRNILSEGLSGFYPFINSGIYDETGILFGTNKDNQNLCIIDRFNRDKYKNGNMCILGSSGSGKSYFTKIQILRERLLNRKQYIIDPEREYKEISDSLEGEYIKFGKNTKTYVNLLEIRNENLNEIQLNKEKLIEVINDKVEKLRSFFKQIFYEMTDSEYIEFEELLKKIYVNTINLNCLKDKEIKKNEVKDNKKIKMPILSDVQNEINKDKKLKKHSNKLNQFTTGALSFFNKQTNIDLNKKIIVADIYDLGEENIKYGIFLFLDLFWDEIRKNKKVEKIIYIDEIWKLIGATATNETASYVYKLFKTIRKYNGCAVCITQDISDLFSIDNGNFGSTILNNSSFKSIFSLNDENIKKVSDYLYLGEKEKIKIRGFSKGENLLMIDNKRIEIVVNSFDFENGLIEKN